MTPLEMITRQQGTLPGLLGIEWIASEPGLVRGRLPLVSHHLAPNGFLHAATVVALADTACGLGCLAVLPEGAKGFTTIELKANYLGTALEGAIACEAKLIHGGRSTQLWDAQVSDEKNGRILSLFRCTQMILR